MPGAPTRLWTPSFVALVVANFGIFVIFYMLTSTLSGWAMDELSASASQAGLVGTAWFAGAVIARFASGHLITRAGQRVTIIGSLSVLMIGCLGYSLVGSVVALVALRGLHGMAYGVAATAVAATALASVPAGRRGEGSGWVSFGMAVATGTAPLVGGWLQTGVGQSAVFRVCSAFAAIALVLGTGVALRLPPHPRRTGGTRTVADYLEVRAMPIGVSVMCTATGFGAILTLIAPYGESIGLGAAAHQFFLVYAAVIMVSRPFAGIVQDRLGDTSIMIPVAIAALAGMICVAMTHSEVVLLVGAGLLGLGYGTMVSGGQTIAINRAGEHRAGVALATYFVLVDGGTGIGPFLMGTIAQGRGYRAAFAVAAALAAVGVVFTTVLVARTRGRAEPL